MTRRVPAGTTDNAGTAAMEPGLISALTTVRNGEAYLADTIVSLLAQTDPHFEVVVVDDGSTDRTPQVLAGLSDPRVRVISSDPVGRVRALIRAAEAARGELLAILDADDIALPHRFAVQRAYLDSHPELALVGSDATEFGVLPDVVKPCPHGPERVRRALAMYNPFYFSSVMVRRAVYEAVGGFPTQYDLCYDQAFLVDVAERYPVDIIPEALIRYRRHPQQMSTTAEWESIQRRRTARFQLQAARRLGLPAPLWIFPVAAWGYAYLPAGLRPRPLKEPVKRALLRFFRLC